MPLALDFGSAAHKLNQLRDGHGSETGNWAGPLFFLIVTVLIAGFVTFPIWSKFLRKKRVFNDLEFNPQHLMKAYVALAGILTPDQPRAIKTILPKLSNYCQTYFGKDYYDFEAEFRADTEDPVSIRSLTYWLNRYLEQNEKERIIRFAEDFRLSNKTISDYKRGGRKLKRFIRHIN